MKKEPMKLEIDREALRKIHERVTKEQAETDKIIAELRRKHALKKQEEQSSNSTDPKET